jgi:uncharacterized protein YgbK (DUF1537 family)
VTAPLLGVIADDLTGACDVADAIAQSGLSTIVLLGVPQDDAPANAECVVVALKSRTIEPGDAVAVSTASAAWLLGHGAETIYQKYCSTFDSTDRGNIGPVSDALAGLVGNQPGRTAMSPLLSVGTPATPVVGRTQYLGHLFVGNQLLAESPLRHHPLTPMTDSNLVRVLGRQTSRPVGLVSLTAVRNGDSTVNGELAKHADAGVGHVLVDAISDDDLDVLARAVRGSRERAPLLLAGAAGFAGAIARCLAADRADHPSTISGSGSHPDSPLPRVSQGKRLILSGSASARSREQSATYDGPVLSFDPIAVARGEVGTDELVAELAALADLSNRPVLVSPVGAADADGERLRAVQAALGTDESAAVVEETLSALASRAVGELGVRSVIVAGGETSGAVATALGVRSLRLGRSAARGVPWMVAETAHGFPVALLLKSGNFGEADLFTTAWEVAP